MADTNCAPEDFAKYGTVLTNRRSLSQLPRAFRRETEVAGVLQVLLHSDKPAVLLTGPSGAGKTAIVQEVAHRLHQLDWEMLEMTAADFMSGTQYMGEWETRCKKLFELVRRPKQKIVLYLPNFELLGSVGKSSRGDSNLADILIPHLARGELTVLAEMGDDVSRAPAALRRVMEQITINPLSRTETLQLSQEVATSEEADLTLEMAERLLELSEFCGSDAVWPGRGLSLLRRTISNRSGNKPITEAEILQAVSSISGVPTLMLDDRLPLSRQAVVQFFQSRVMGQKEAVEAAVDLTMMIKSGLTDPNKPMSSLLFVGPTGVGKTELARAIAEYCMGDPNRLVRLDMSEFATPDAGLRLLGSTEHPGALTTPVRERPFSIVLLDEFEKANYSVFDLCLQLFDAGRLTDLDNRAVDFRRCVVILTSNLGAQVTTTPAMGFGGANGVTAIDTKTRQNSERALERAFRPEFLNRLDRIIHFTPLERDTLEAITRRELTRALDRTGIHRRRLNVQFDAEIVPLLLQKGYSPAYGARPLKRTIERMVLVPLARQIATGRLPSDSTVLLGLKGGTVRARVLKLGEVAEESRPVAPPIAAANVVQSPAETIAELSEQAQRMTELLEPMDVRKSQLLKQVNAIQGPALSQNRAEFGEIHRLEAILTRFEKFRQALSPWLNHPSRGRKTVVAQPTAEDIASLRLQRRLLDLLMAEPSEGSMADVVLSIRLLESRGQRLQVVETLAKMYLAFLRRMGFKVDVVDDQCSEKPRVDQISLLIEGAGAHFVLRQEHGLHVLRQTRQDQTQRETAKVEVLALEQGTLDNFADQCQVKTRQLKNLVGRFGKKTSEASLFHTRTQVCLNVVAEIPAKEVAGRLSPWLAALVTRQENALASPADRLTDVVVRRYELGPNALVRDVATGLRWGQPDRLFSGWLDRFVLVEPTAPPTHPG